MSGSARNHLVAMSGLPGIGPARLRRVFELDDPVRAWARLCVGRLDDELSFSAAESRAVAVAAAATDLDAVAAAHDAASVRIDILGERGYPSRLADDHAAPVLLFSRGDVGLLSEPSVAIVGTRRATGYGRDVAFALGRSLSAAGVGVVSGLALGIDAAAHSGALRAGTDVEASRGTRTGSVGPVIAVVGCGLDVDYPVRNRALRAAIEAVGVVLAEVPLGTPPAPWRFPARNRIIAALSDAVVVAESAYAGGSMITVDEATTRSRPVLAVPGPVNSGASTGTNQLISDGCAPCRDHSDVLVALGLSSRAASPARHDAAFGQPAVSLDEVSTMVLDAVQWSPTPLDRLAAETALDFGELCRVLDGLVAAGLIRDLAGRYERSGT